MELFNQGYRLPGFGFTQAQILNLDTVIDDLHLRKGSNTNFNTAIDGSQGVTVQKLENDSGAYITFSRSLSTDQQIAIMTKMLDQTTDPAAKSQDRLRIDCLRSSVWDNSSCNTYKVSVKNSYGGAMADPFCMVNEALNSMGPNRCRMSIECSGARTCSGFGYCQGVSGC